MKTSVKDIHIVFALILALGTQVVFSAMGEMGPSGQFQWVILKINALGTKIAIQKFMNCFPMKSDPAKKVRGEYIWYLDEAILYAYLYLDFLF